MVPSIRLLSKTEDDSVHHRLARLAAGALLGAAYISVPIAPLLASAVFWRKKYVLNYRNTMLKAVRHIRAMQRGPALHFFRDVAGQVQQVPEHIKGECVQCGNCCMNHQCMFLEPTGQDQFQCGIYHSPLRKASNCGSFPLHRQDIERYSCPSYFVAPAPQQAVIRIHPVQA